MKAETPQLKLKFYYLFDVEPGLYKVYTVYNNHAGCGTVCQANLSFKFSSSWNIIYSIQYIIIMQDEELYARLILVLNFPPAGILYTVYSI